MNFLTIDPGLANMGLCFANTDTDTDTIRRTLKTASPGITANRIYLQIIALNMELDELPPFTAVYIEDYVDRSNLQASGMTLKLIGALCLYFKERHYSVTMLTPGAGGWQSKVKKEFKKAQYFTGKGWNEHTRDAWCMAEYVKKYILKGV